MEYYSAIKKEWNNAICSNMDGLSDNFIMLSKSDIERQIPYSITYMWNLKYAASYLIYTIETHWHRRPVYGYQKWKKQG